MEETVTMILMLANGDQLIATVAESHGAYVCTDVLNILVQPDPASGQMQMGLMEYLPYADMSAGIAIPTHMAIIAVPGEELLNHYNKKFGKIILPSSKIIM